MKNYTFSAVVYKDGKFYVAECPQVGTVSQGGTVEEALANLKEATELYLEEFPEYSSSNPLLTTRESRGLKKIGTRPGSRMRCSDA